LLDSKLSATAPYFDFTDSKICSVMILSQNIYAKTTIFILLIFVKAYTMEL